MTSLLQLLHILLSTLVLGVLCFAAIQALLLAIQEWQLRHKKSGLLLGKLPAMDVMEVFLFRVIKWGFLLLTLVLLISLFSFQSLLNPLLEQKIVLSLFAWLIFLVLLSGRYYFGWRGRVAVRWTLIGVICVVIVYVGAILIHL